MADPPQRQREQWWHQRRSGGRQRRADLRLDRLRELVDLAEWELGADIGGRPARVVAGWELHLEWHRRSYDCGGNLELRSAGNGSSGRMADPPQRQREQWWHQHQPRG